MDIELLAKAMRERALLIEADENLSEQSFLREKSALDFARIQAEKEKKRARLEELKKLYFNAGRWVGGARDDTARKAFIAMREREK